MTEEQLKYIHDRMCAKYRPRNCDKCPLSKWRNGCQVGIMINVIKEWAKDNISEDILRRKSDVSAGI